MLLLRPLVLFTSLASAAALAPRLITGTETVLSDLANLEKAVQSQITALNNFKGGLLGTPLQLTAISATFDATVLAMTKAAASVVLLPGPFSAEDSKKVTDQLTATLAISDPKVCALIKTKRAQFDAVLMRPIVYGNLNILQGDHLLLSGSLTAHMDPAYTARMQEIADITTRALDDAIAYYKFF